MVASEAFSEHPYAPPGDGAHFVDLVHRALAANAEVFDHTSVLRFLETWTTALGTPAACPNISAWRRRVTGDPTGVFDFARPVYGVPAGLPSTAKVIGRATASRRRTRPRRATPCPHRSPAPGRRAPCRTR